jgi:hypothetical protein
VIWREIRDVDSEAISARLAQQIPGFGGWFFDRQGNLNVWVVDPQKHGARARVAVAAAAREVVPGAKGSNFAILIRQGRYSWQELSTWWQQMDSIAGEIPGIRRSDLDELRNRVSLGVSSRAGRGVARRKAAELGIPAGAVNVMVEECDPTMVICEGQEDPCATNPDDPSCTEDPCTLYPDDPNCQPPMEEEAVTGNGSIEPNLSYGEALTSEFSTVRGGIMIQFQKPEYIDGCSVGLVLRTQYYGNVFMTNSHCTTQHGGGTGTEYGQPTLSRFFYIGREVVDPFYKKDFYCGWRKTCLGQSRNSDAAIVKIDGNKPADIGVIARPALRMNRFAGKGTTNINQLLPILRVQDYQPTILGSHVDKIGMETGWTVGYVNAKCETIYQTFLRRHFCQDRADFVIAKGDSGGPVFYYLENSGEKVNIVGIVHSMDGTYSPLNKIWDDVGVHTGNWGW